MFRQYYQLGIVALSIILCATLTAVVWHVTKCALTVEQIPVVQQAHDEVKDRIPLIYQARDTINAHIQDVENILNYEIK